MRVLCSTPWNNSWVPAYRQAFEYRRHEFTTGLLPKEAKPDVTLHMWADPSMFMDGSIRGKVNIVFMRRYEFFTYPWDRFDWDAIDAMVFVNGKMKSAVDKWAKEAGAPARTHLIRNGLMSKDWPFVQHKRGKTIGMACHVHPKKNLPLAVHILNELPRDYTLDIAGDVQDEATAEYVLWMAHRLGLTVRVHGHIDNIASFWSGHDYCLSTSISEGNPMNVIEAMLMGVKPIVHEWPDAATQFPGFTFRTIGDAINLIRSDEYDSRGYRAFAEEYYGIRNIQAVVRLAEELHNGESTATDRAVGYETYP